MRRTVRYLKYRRDEWRQRAGDEEARGELGAAGYSCTQARGWNSLLKRAVREFGVLIDMPDDILGTVFE